jgi:hypothetical protein
MAGTIKVHLSVLGQYTTAIISSNKTYSRPEIAEKNVKQQSLTKISKG